MSITRRSIYLLVTGPCIRLFGAQIIPNPNQDRLGFPQHPDTDTPQGSKGQQEALSKRAHTEALKSAEDLVTKAQQLRDDLKKAGNYVVPISLIAETEKIEKLAKRIRTELKT